MVSRGRCSEPWLLPHLWPPTSSRCLSPGLAARVWRPLHNIFNPKVCPTHLTICCGNPKDLPKPPESSESVPHRLFFQSRVCIYSCFDTSHHNPPCPSIEKDSFTIPKSPCIHTADIYIPHLILTCRPHALYCRLIPGQDPRPFVSPTTSLPISLSAPHPHFPISPSQSPAPPSPLHSHSTYQPNSAYPFP